jgi:hypothetical protein
MGLCTRAAPATPQGDAQRLVCPGPLLLQGAERHHGHRFERDDGEGQCGGEARDLKRKCHFASQNQCYRNICYGDRYNKKQDENNPRFQVALVDISLIKAEREEILEHAVILVIDVEQNDGGREPRRVQARLKQLRSIGVETLPNR